MSYDQACETLAEHFLPALAPVQYKGALAQHIQTAVEDWLNCSLPEMEARLTERMEWVLRTEENKHQFRPITPGWHAILYCWDSAEEGVFDGAGYWNGGWPHHVPITAFSSHPFLTREAAASWAEKNNPDNKL